MAIPVQIQTNNQTLLWLYRLPLVGGWFIFGLATLPGIILSYAFSELAPQFAFLRFYDSLQKDDVAFAIAGFVVCFYNLLLVRYSSMRIKIAFIPAWLLGLIVGVVQTLIFSLRYFDETFWAHFLVIFAKVSSVFAR